MKEKERKIDIAVDELIRHYDYKNYLKEITKVAHCDIEKAMDLTFHFEHTELPMLIKTLQFLKNRRNKKIIISSDIDKIQLDEFTALTLSYLLESHIQETAQKYVEEIQRNSGEANPSLEDISIFCQKHVKDFKLDDEVFLKSIQKTFTEIGILKVNKEYREGLNKEYAFINDMYAILKGEYIFDWSIPDKEKADKVKYLLEKDIKKGRNIFIYIDFLGKRSG